MKTITINVTKKDIEKSARKEFGGSADCCPIYNAIQRHKELHGYLVGQQILYKHGNSINLPAKARELSKTAWLSVWDRIKPIKFQVTLP